MTKQLNTDQLDRLAEIKEEILVDRGPGPSARHAGGAACQPLVRDLLYSVRQGQYSSSDSTITMQETIDALKGGTDA